MEFGQNVRLLFRFYDFLSVSDINARSERVKKSGQSLSVQVVYGLFGCAAGVSVRQVVDSCERTRGYDVKGGGGVAGDGLQGVCEHVAVGIESHLIFAGGQRRYSCAAEMASARGVGVKAQSFPREDVLSPGCESGGQGYVYASVILGTFVADGE